MNDDMKEFEFTLEFVFTDIDPDLETYVNKLGEAGCTDAIIGIGQKGRMAMQFAREANTALEARTSAIRDVKSAIPTAKLIASPITPMD